MKKLDKIVKNIILILLGAMMFGFISEAAEICQSREPGNFGGEIFIIPLFAGLVWLGWQMRGNLK